MASNSDTALATQQSIKAYVDAGFDGKANNEANASTSTTITFLEDTIHGTYTTPLT
jgi:hypothetical protein